MNQMELIEKADSAYQRRCQKQGWISPALTGSTVQGSRVILRWGSVVVAIYEVYGNQQLRWLAQTDKRLKHYEST